MENKENNTQTLLYIWNAVITIFFIAIVYMFLAKDHSINTNARSIENLEHRIDKIEYHLDKQTNDTIIINNYINIKQYDRK